MDFVFSTNHCKTSVLQLISTSTEYIILLWYIRHRYYDDHTCKDNYKAMRDDFPTEVIRICKMQAAFICSRPECRRLTVAPSINDEMSIQYNGKVAHISAASPGGPRYNEQMTSEQRKSISNAIFLCSSCADLIDKNNGVDYNINTIEGWKKDHLKWVLKSLNKSGLMDNQFQIENHFQYGGITAQIVNINAPFASTDEKIQHDILRFKEADNIFNEEQIVNFYYDLTARGKCVLSDLKRISDVYNYYSKIGNMFLSSALEKSKAPFLKSINSLRVFIFFNFDGFDYDTPGNVDLILQLKQNNKEVYPEHLLKSFPDAFKWNNLNYPKLEKLANSFKQNYSRFRILVKQNLHL